MHFLVDRLTLGGIISSQAAMVLSSVVVGVVLLVSTIPGNIPGFVAALQAAAIVIGTASIQAGALGQLRESALRLQEAAPWIWGSFASKVHLKTPASVLLKRFYRIQCQNLTFQYPSRRDSAIARVTAQMEHGQLVALIGHNGAGKTTFARCLLGHLTPTSGVVLVDGAPLAVNPAWTATSACVAQCKARDHLPFSVRIRQTMPVI